MNSDSEFMDRLEKMENFTLFAPSNAAFEDLSIQSYLSNHTYIKSLLNLHIVNRRLTINDIEAESVDKVYNLYFIFNSLSLIYYAILFLWYLKKQNIFSLVV